MTSLFKTPKMPTIESPDPIPQADDAAVEAARKKAIAGEQKKSSVQSNDLGGRETLGA